MNVVPIVFCFDDAWVLPAGVCITSLLENAKEDTFYDIFILYADEARFPFGDKFDGLQQKFPNSKITFRCVGQAFKDAYEVRGIKVSTYYRLLIPELIPEYDKIMYHDVDVIFRSDLANVFFSTDINDFYMAGVYSSDGVDVLKRDRYIKLGLDWKCYMLCGNLIINSRKIREDGLMEKFKWEVRNRAYEFQDMDIINLVCKGRLKRMAPSFCVTVEISNMAANNIEQEFYSLEELWEAQKRGIIHYNGAKPWIGYCVNYDFWWEYYRKSIFFDPKFYFNYYYSRLYYLDELSLWKRIKLVVRFLKTGGPLK